MEDGGRDGFRLERAQRCRSAQAGDVADLTRAGESDDHAVFLGSSCRSRLHGWIPMAVDGTVNHWRRIRLPDSSGKRGSDWDSLRSPLGAKILCLRPGAARRSPSARVSRASALFRRSGRYGHRNLAQAPEHVGSNQHGQGARLRFRFRLSSVNTTVACPVM